jgi:hypothetical protein
MFGQTVQHIEGERIEHALDEVKARKGVTGDFDPDADDLQELVALILGEAEKRRADGEQCDRQQDRRDARQHCLDRPWQGSPSPAARAVDHLGDICTDRAEAALAGPPNA